ncbi:hypothetical protein JMUB3935_0888 [Leptotrichia trevisanii]|uniref:Uncharacterized protein n=1 Tax=Leptotrichia trevisanii TaxID=109328 RepID=A0A510KJQ1_9FUSO|nr:hypothetical protein [Leptotrichia trevisanii]BBM51910.1 hypothetical protein JMUB3935_0888 [Leptotrichia trevisanii]
MITENKKWIQAGHYNDGLFPRIDFVDITDPKNPIGISYKTMDLNAPSYTKKSDVERIINRYSDDVLKTKNTGSGKKHILKDIEKNSNYFQKNNHITKSEIESMKRSIIQGDRALIIEVPPGSKIPFTKVELDKMAKKNGLKYIRILASKF